MTTCFFKSLSGNIIQIQKDTWNDIRSDIASLHESHPSQVIIFDTENIENTENIPEIIQNKLYNFLIRENDPKFISYKQIKNSYDYKTKEKYKVCEIYIYDNSLDSLDKQIQKITIYNKKNNYYHESNILNVFVKNNKEYIKFAHKNSEDIYDILSKNVKVPWYDKHYIIERIMLQMFQPKYEN